MDKQSIDIPNHQPRLTERLRRSTMAKYPKRILIDTPDGGGEAVKDKKTDAWRVATPTRDFRFYGSVTEMKAEVRLHMKTDYPSESTPVTFI